MLSYEQILELMDKLVKSPLEEINISQGDFNLNLKKNKENSENSEKISLDKLANLLEKLKINSSCFQPNFQPSYLSERELNNNFKNNNTREIAEQKIQEYKQEEIKQQTQAVNNINNNLVEIKSPMVGTFYKTPSPDAPAFVEVGKKINSGDTLCIIEAMKVMNELPAEINCIIEEICVESGAIVEFGQVLFRVKLI